MSDTGPERFRVPGIVCNVLQVPKTVPAVNDYMIVRQSCAKFLQS